MMTTTFPVFPSREHWAYLKKKLADAGYSEERAFPDQTQLWQFHHYDYAWRRVFMETHEQTSEIDPKGRFYDPSGIMRAEQMFRRPPPPPQRLTPADRAEAEGDRLRHAGDDVGADAAYEKANRWRAQDKARAEAKARITGDGRNPDGTPTKEAIEFVELCCAQARANTSTWIGLNRRAVTPPRAEREAEEMGELQRSLGVRATEEGVA